MTTMGDMALTAQAPALMPESPSDVLGEVSTTKMNRPTPAMLGTSVDDGELRHKGAFHFEAPSA